jgi:hypothetical protein
VWNQTPAYTLIHLYDSRTIGLYPTEAKVGRNVCNTCSNTWRNTECIRYHTNKRGSTAGSKFTEKVTFRSVLNRAPSHECIRGTEDVATHILEIGSDHLDVPVFWRWQRTLDNRWQAGRSHGCCRKDNKSFLLLSGIKPQSPLIHSATYPLLWPGYSSST